MPKGNINYESAEEPRLRIVVLAKGLQQPWSMAFLPDGAILVTERIGRLGIVRNGNLVSSPVAGVPAVKPGGPRGLQGLMDVVLHPHFSENKWVYLKQRIRDVRQGPDGLLYVLTAEEDGALLRIEPR